VEVNGLLLDTSGYSALSKDHSGVVRAIAEAENVFLNPVILGELLAGFRKGTQGDRNQGLLSVFIERESVEILAVDENTAHRYALIHDYLRRAGTPVSPNDLWIAATAMQHGLSILTADRDFQKIPQVALQFFETL
jgi:tRNA(fMet)-specific endonuclease VapC